jgi:hypothetical protein
MATKVAAVIFAGALLAPAQTTQAAEDEKKVDAAIALVRTDIRKARAQVMSETMGLDADQAAKFWPVFKEYEAEFSAVGDKMQSLVKEYGNNYAKMTPEVADRLGKGMLDVEQQRLAMKIKYVGKIKAALGPVVATRFAQVLGRLERLLDLQLASELPIIR